MKVLDLFSGIGGFSLGLEWAGMSTVAFCERDPYCTTILKKHFSAAACETSPSPKGEGMQSIGLIQNM